MEVNDPKGIQLPAPTSTVSLYLPENNSILFIKIILIIMPITSETPFNTVEYQWRK
jgi:hypothetical protein